MHPGSGGPGSSLWLFEAIETQNKNITMTFDKKLLRKVHRWLGLFAGIQLLTWTVSGLYFTLIPIEEIRGNHLLVNELESPLASGFDLISQSELTALHSELNEARLEDFQFMVTNNVPVYLVEETRFDAQTGARLESVSEREALHIVSARTGLKSKSKKKDAYKVLLWERRQCNRCPVRIDMCLLLA